MTQIRGQEITQEIERDDNDIHKRVGLYSSSDSLSDDDSDSLSLELSLRRDVEGSLDAKGFPFFISQFDLFLLESDPFRDAID